MTLKCIRRTARLECAAAKNSRTAPAHMVCSREKLLLGLDRTRPSDGDKVVATNFEVQHPHNCLLVFVAP
jgi:hypothetical protein